MTRKVAVLSILVILAIAGLPRNVSGSDRHLDLFFCDGSYVRTDLRGNPIGERVIIELESVGSEYRRTAATSVCMSRKIVFDPDNDYYYIIFDQVLPGSEGLRSRFAVGKYDPKKLRLVSRHEIGVRDNTDSNIDLEIDSQRLLLLVTGPRKIAFPIGRVADLKPVESGVSLAAERVGIDPNSPAGGGTSLRNPAFGDLRKQVGSRLSHLKRPGLPDPIAHFLKLGASNNRVLMLAGMDAADRPVKDAAVAVLDPESGQVEEAFVVDTPITTNYFGGRSAHLAPGNRWLIAEHYFWVNEVGEAGADDVASHSRAHRLGRVSIFDVAVGRRTAQVEIGPAGASPQFMMFSEDGHAAFFTYRTTETSAARLVALDLARGAVRFDIPVEDGLAYVRIR